MNDLLSKQKVVQYAETLTFLESKKATTLVD